MRYLHTLLLLATLGFFLACGNQRPNHIDTTGTDAMSMLVDHIAISPGDRVNVLLGDRVVLHNIEVMGVDYGDAQRDDVELRVSPAEADTFLTAYKANHHTMRLQRTSTN